MSEIALEEAVENNRPEITAAVDDDAYKTVCLCL